MTQTQEKYNSHEHLIKIKAKDGTVKDYLPANWRLHELRVTYPTATIESEIVHMDVEHNFVIIKAMIFDGKTYEESAHRASSMKQGLLSNLDKVETGAKSRAARDFGIGTEYALEVEPEEDLDTPPAQPAKPVTKKPPVQAVPPQQNGHQPTDKMSEQQESTIRKLCEHLGKSIPEGLEAFTNDQAKATITQLSTEYRAARGHPR